MGMPWADGTAISSARIERPAEPNEKSPAVVGRGFARLTGDRFKAPLTIRCPLPGASGLPAGREVHCLAQEPAGPYLYPTTVPYNRGTADRSILQQEIIRGTPSNSDPAQLGAQPAGQVAVLPPDAFAARRRPIRFPVASVESNEPSFTMLLGFRELIDFRVAKPASARK